MRVPALRARGISTLILVVLAAAVGFLYAKKNQLPLIGAESREAVVVDYAIDGDTIKLPSGERVRLIGIDAPEKGQCFYEESRQFAQSFLDGRTVILERDISGEDDYQRLLRYVFFPAPSESEDREFVNDALVRQGYARAVASPRASARQPTALRPDHLASALNPQPCAMLPRLSFLPRQAVLCALGFLFRCYPQANARPI
ncbi:MAG: thermonuclease family protein [Parcubacteria group bacterium]|nr:thermonuclease family protein [Parcubacteria group bacterium]